MPVIWRHTRKLFDEIPQRTTLIQTSLHRLFHSASCYADKRVEYPFGSGPRESNVVPRRSMISSLVDRGLYDEAIHGFKGLIVNEGRRINFGSVLAVLRAIGGLKWEDMVWSVHGFVIKMGFAAEVPVVTTLMNVYGEFGMVAVWKLFRDLPVKDVVSWSSMVALFGKNGEYDEAVELFQEMLRDGIEPSYVTALSVLPVCAKVGLLSFGKQVHGWAMKWAFCYHGNVQNSLIDMYAKCGDLEASIQAFGRVENKDLVAWKTMTRGFLENECAMDALHFFSTMLSSCVAPDEIIVCDVIGAASEAREQKFGLGFHCYCLKTGLLEFIAVGTTLLQMYAKFGQVSPARVLFDQLHRKDLIAWSAMVAACAQSSQPSDAFHVLEQMKIANEQPNEVTFVSLLQACSLMGAQEVGESIQGHLTKVGHMRNPFLVSALIDLYCKSGRVKQGQAVFDQSPAKDLVCWSSLISGYGLNGFGSEALDTFINMLNSGIWPNEVVFVSVLAACGHCGMDDEAWYWFNSMQDNYGITPELAHCACMVDLLSRQGKVEEALEFVKTMLVEPDNRIWGTLLAGCRISNVPIEITEQVAYRLMDLDPENTICYVFLSNLYAEEGRWKDVQKLRRLLEERGLRKALGYSVAGSS
ncbi:Pentatricopeptide repeat-containing protein [Drosera capensis]